jgi:hypothetical protein
VYLHVSGSGEEAGQCAVAAVFSTEDLTEVVSWDLHNQVKRTGVLKAECFGRRALQAPMMM